MLRTLPLLLLLLALAQPAVAETIHSLGQVKQHLKTPEGKAFVSEQLQGNPAPDRLGTHLPAALSAGAIKHLLLPAGESAQVGLVGAKPWSAARELYVAIVCTGGEPFDPKYPQCARGYPGEKTPPLHVYLGVIDAKEGAAPVLVAAGGPIDLATSWEHSGLPREPMTADDTETGALQPESVDGFDLAHYRIGPKQIAFGVRTGWTESYSGGGASFTALNLFTIDGKRLSRVLSAPMSAYANIAGDWHKDGTRDHDITDADNVLVVSSHRTAGYFDMVIKARRGHWQRRYRWSEKAGAYEPASGNIAP